MIASMAIVTRQGEPYGIVNGMISACLTKSKGGTAMGFWIFMLIMNLMIPLLMIGLGRWFWRRAPKKINPLFGYRTTMSMKNQDTWQFAHHYFGKLWFGIGWILLPVSIIPLLFVAGRSENTVGMAGGIVCAAQTAVLLCSIIPVETALKRTFDRDGKRKND